MRYAFYLTEFLTERLTNVIRVLFAFVCKCCLTFPPKKYKPKTTLTRFVPRFVVVESFCFLFIKLLFLLKKDKHK